MRSRLIAVALVASLVAAAGLGGKTAWHRLHWKQAVNPAPRQHLVLERPRGRPLRVLFVGDSLTVGAAASRRAAAFPQIVAGALRERGPVVELLRAKGGVTAAYWRERPLPTADVVVIEVGTNDFSNDLTPPTEFGREYRALIAHVRRASPRAKVACVSIWRSSQYGYRGESLATYNGVIASACPGAFVFISNLYDRGYYAAINDRKPVGRPGFVSDTDGFHPNDRGHRDIAAAILTAITEHSRRPSS